MNVKHISIVLLLLLSFTELNAQEKLTIADIKGKWELVRFNMSGLYYDWHKDSLRLPAEMKANIYEEDMATTIAKIKQSLTPYTKVEVHITDTDYTHYHQEQILVAKYTLIEKEGKQMLRIEDQDDEDDPEVNYFVVTLQEGLLHLTPIEKKGENLLVFRKK